jgi:hypothetical protein
MFPSMDGQADLELERPRGVGELLGTTFDLYWRYPLLFLTLAAAVLVPYELIVLAATGTGPLDRGSLGFAVSTSLDLLDLALVTSLISALHVHAVADVRAGRPPKLAAVAGRGLAALPVVSVVVVLSYLGVIVGLVALIVPGVLLLLRWAVAAQAAAIEDGNWKNALRRSGELTKSNYGHVLGLFLLVLLITAVPSFAISRAFHDSDSTVTSFLANLALEIVVRSFTALATGLLYFDLRARFASAPASATGDAVEQSPQSLDPGVYTDEERPPGWYVDPEAPWRMRYWGSEGGTGWSRRTTKTPKQVLANWRDLRWQRERS